MADRRRSSVVEVARSNDGVLRVNDNAVRKMSIANATIADEVADAREATEKEHQLSIRDACKLYPKAICFSLLFSTAVIMEGYDLSLMGSFFGFPLFKDVYGTQPDPETGGMQISAAWQTGITNGTQVCSPPKPPVPIADQCQVGSIIGLYLNGIISDKFGYKKTMFGSLILMIAFIFLPVFAPNIQTILAGAILQGIPWGVFQTLTVTYASDVTPVVLRPYLTTYVNLCWVIGQLIAAGTLRGCLQLTTQWAYRIPFAIQWLWPVPILVGCLFAPESPWWLVRKDRIEDARKSLLSLTSRSSGVQYNVDDQISMIRATNELEKAMSGGKTSIRTLTCCHADISVGTSYLDCFRGVDLRRTEISSMAWITQAFCGSALMGYSVQFYIQAGLSDNNSFNFNIGQYAMGVVGTIGSWFLMPHVGRRTLYIAGLAIMFGILIVVGGLGFANGTGPSYAVGSLLLIYTFVYDITVGPVCYSIVAEVPSTRLKIKTVVLARQFYNVGGIINNVLMPRMLLNTEWNWGAKVRHQTSTVYHYTDHLCRLACSGQERASFF